MLIAQSTSSKYIVYFKDKSTNIDIECLYTPKALEKRKQHNIAFDERDIPINTQYIDELSCNNIEIINQSNWLNAVLISTNENTAQSIKKLDFVQSIVPVLKTSNHSNIASKNQIDNCNSIQDFEDNFANSYAQFHLLNGEYLHEQGFNGEDMTIAVCDNGFYNVNNNAAFANIFAENRMLGTYDYVHGDSLVFDESVGSHGAFCFSFIAATKANEYIGTATKAKYYLFHTEDNASEQLQEEFNLATALERCSQLGVDVVSISLGYYIFDNAHSFQNHDTADMMKNITPAAKAVNIAASKGILVCVAAGNEGTSSWHYIISPADADSAFTIASVDINGNPSSFSSYGLATNPRVKPNVAAVGQSANFINTDGNVGAGSGTSYATPSLAGMSACLWQAFPTKTNWEIKTAIEQSASQYLTPDKKIGYGIPDFKKAYQILSIPTPKFENDYTIFPNPFKNIVNIGNNNFEDVLQIKLIDFSGNLILDIKNPSNSKLNLTDFPNGIYMLQIITNKGQIVKRLLKG